MAGGGRRRAGAAGASPDKEVRFEAAGRGEEHWEEVRKAMEEDKLKGEKMVDVAVSAAVHEGVSRGACDRRRGDLRREFVDGIQDQIWGRSGSSDGIQERIWGPRGSLDGIQERIWGPRGS